MPDGAPTIVEAVVQVQSAFQKASGMTSDKQKYFVDKYKPYLRDPKLSDADKTQFIVIIHKILKTFVDEAFGTYSHRNLQKNSEQNLFIGHSQSNEHHDRILPSSPKNE